MPDRIIFNPFTGNFDYVRDQRPIFTVGADVDVGDLLAYDSNGQLQKATSLFSQNLYKVATVATTDTLASGSAPFTSIGKVVSVRFALAPLAVHNGQGVFLSDTAGQATLNPSNSSGYVRFFVGTLVGADGITETPLVHFNPYYVARIP